MHAWVRNRASLLAMVLRASHSKKGVAAGMHAWVRDRVARRSTVSEQPSVLNHHLLFLLPRTSVIAAARFLVYGCLRFNGQRSWMRASLAIINYCMCFFLAIRDLHKKWENEKQIFTYPGELYFAWPRHVYGKGAKRAACPKLETTYLSACFLFGDHLS